MVKRTAAPFHVDVTLLEIHRGTVIVQTHYENTQSHDCNFFCNIAFQVIVTLHGGDDYRFINVEEYGLVSAYRPRLSAGDVQTMVEVTIATVAYCCEDLKMFLKITPCKRRF